MDTRYDDKENFARLISIAKRHLDIWSQQNLRYNGTDIKLSYLPVIFNISPGGTTNTELSKRSLVFKQAMSRTLKELEAIGMITSTPLSKDKRSNRIALTEEGKQFVADSSEKLSAMISRYIGLVGEKDLKTTIKVLSAIIDLHEGLVDIEPE